MVRNLYHGADRIVRAPVFGAGNSFNDYGLGFYCTESLELAREWAVSSRANGFVSKYTLETAGLRVVDLSNPQFCILHWLAVLLNYREFDAQSQTARQAKDYIRTEFNVDYQSADCMLGYRADNSNFTFAQDFLNGEISYREFARAVRLGEQGRQVVLRTNRAFERLTYAGFEAALCADAYAGKMARDRELLRRAYGLAGRAAAGDQAPSADGGIIQSRAAAPGDFFVSQLLAEEVKSYDARLR